ncbi:hypothetical protein LCGC14_1400340 [marine sediment metagenome]|uniref:Uncharacterized protein n=1 Tax=marine sediment metagenome TaxID=412755 RepID=A0A0F9JX97_9ZZZZ
MAKHPTQESWARRPNEEDMPITFLVNRAGPKGHEAQIILSHDVEGGYVHFARGRSVKCPKGPCEHCKANSERRWRGYCVCANARNRELTLVELTAAAMKPIDIYFRQHRTLRGALLTTKRIPEKPNGRLYATIVESAQAITSYPAVPSVRSLLRKLWGLPKDPDANGDVQRKIREADDDTNSQTA